MTVGEWSAIVSDIDGYLDRGGKLLDLQLYDLDALPSATQEIIKQVLGPERLLRWERFLQAVSQASTANTGVEGGKRLTEEDVRSIWRASAEPPSRTLH
jgi:hypothetical protein